MKTEGELSQLSAPKKPPVKTYSRAPRGRPPLKKDINAESLLLKSLLKDEPVKRELRPRKQVPETPVTELTADGSENVDDLEESKEVEKSRQTRKPSTPGKSEGNLKCGTCPRTFTTPAGFKRHSVACKGNSSTNKKAPDKNENRLSTEDIKNLGDGAVKTVNVITVSRINNNKISIQSNTQVADLEEAIKQTENNMTIEISENAENSHDMATFDKDFVTEPGKCHCCGEDLETAHSGGEFQCADCAKLFKLKSSLERHRRVIHNEGETFQCPECNARCPDKGTLARHMYTHTGLKPYSCPHCKKEFSRKYHLVRHNMQTGCDGSTRPVFPCQVCGRVFNRKDNLREHLRAHAGQTKRKKKYNCEHCNKEFLGTTLLHIHKRTHTGEKPYQCDMCEKRFPSRGAMKKHRRKHTGERPYECKQCFARFAAKETLNRHMRTHTGIKPHSCHYCGKSFIQASQLRAHIFHHSGENGFTCEQCGKSFNRRTRLQLHVKYVHEGAEPFTCEQCNKTFVRKEDLARHHILHSGIKAHKCPICEKCFAMKSSLKIHLLTHTKEPPRSCDECGRAFIRQDCLLRHMRTKHRDMLEEIMAEAEKKKLQQQLLAAADEAALELNDPDEPNVLTEEALADSVRELLTLLVDETTLKAFGWPDAPVDRLLEAVIRRCGHQPAGFIDMNYADRLRENAKLLFTVVIDDSAVKTLLNNQTVDEVILHVLRLAKS